MTAPAYAVGIDLGTTHCVVAASRLDRPRVAVIAVPQLIAPGEIASRPLLPSFTYIPADAELADHDRALPWGTTPRIAGELARRLGAKVPSRLVASAKSWICYGGVNRKAAILPWGAPDDAPHLSPFDAQVDYLSHLKAAWDAEHPEAPLAQQDVVVTVPASFDESARELTTEAAKLAGLGDIRLIEEPQAALYDFIGENDEQLASTLADAKLILVVDVGGGTTDLTLVRVLPADATSHGKPRLERIAVGGHLMLGGDNMDAALAHHALEKDGGNKSLDPSEWSALVQACRDAKERLLGDNPPEEVVVTMQARGSRLIGGSRSITIHRDDALRVLVDGFVPHTKLDDVAGGGGRAGLTTLGLPYVTDAAIPRHVAAFLKKHSAPRPDAVLLNGGVFNGKALVTRFAEVLNGWYAAPVRFLAHTSLDTAVARGAARFALARRGVGSVITGGAARAYYIGVDDAHGVRQALCITPRGMDEGTSIDVSGRVFELALDRRVGFPLYAATDRTDTPGDLVGDVANLEILPQLEAVLRARGTDLKLSATGGVAVRLTASLSDTGALGMFLATVQLPPQRWQLEFALEAPPPAAPVAPAAATAKAEKLPERFGDARRLVERIFAKPDPEANVDAAKSLRNDLDDLLGPRGEWTAVTCRALADVALERAGNRGRSEAHELAWLRLVGWCLRPGIGADGDAARVAAMWKVRGEGLKHASKGNFSEWWIVFRRIAQGLGANEQRALFAELAPWLGPTPPTTGTRLHGAVEMLQLAAALERVSAAAKEQAGTWFLAKPTSWLTLGRLGNRVPSSGYDPSQVVRVSVATEWLEKLLALDWAKAEGASFAAVLLARRSPQASTDVDAGLRERVAERLRAIKASASWQELLTRPANVEAKDAARILGDSLPAGLRLAS